MRQYYIPTKELKKPPDILDGFLELVPVSHNWLYGFMCRHWAWFEEEGRGMIDGLFYDAVMDQIDSDYEDDENQLYQLKAEAMAEECSDDIIAYLYRIFMDVFPYIHPFMRDNNPEDIIVELIHCDFNEGAIVVTIKELDGGKKAIRR